MIRLPVRSRFVPVILALCAGLAACAGDPAADPAARKIPVQIPRTLPYAEDAASGAIRADCSFPTYLPQKIVEEAASRHITVELSDADLAEVKQGRVLRIKTLYLEASDGGGYTGEKKARIRGELLQDGRVIGDFTIQRNTGRSWPPWSGWTACSSLERDADALAEDVAEWLTAPQMGTREGDQ